MNHLNPYGSRFLPIKETTLVQRLPVAAILPEGKINGFSTENPESYMASIGFCDEDTSPTSPTIAIWTSFKEKRLHSFEFCYGGPNLDVYLPLGKWFGCGKLAQGSADTIMSLSQEACSLRFLKN